MALGADGFDELVTSTLEKIDKSTLYDNVTTRHPTLDWLRSEQRSATGRQLVVNLELAEDTSTQWTDDSGTFSTDVSGEIAGAGVFEWSDPLVSSVRLRWKRVKMNSGPEQIIDLVNAHIRSMEKAHKKTLVEAVHALVDDSDGASEIDSGQFNSLDQIVSDAEYDADPHGDDSNDDAFDVGQIDASDQDAWQAHRLELPKDGDFDIRQAFRHVENEVYVGTDANNEADKVVAGREIFEEFVDSFDGKVRYTEFGEGQAKFTEVKHGNLAVRLDPDCPSKRAYFLDNDSLVLRALAGTFMERQASQVLEGKLDRVTPIASVLALGTNERRANAVLLRPDTSGEFA